jgi:hypothetical protein
MNFRTLGSSVSRVYFLIKNYRLDEYQLWVSENGLKITKLVSGIKQRILLLDIVNAPYDILATYNMLTKQLDYYHIPNVRVGMNPDKFAKSCRRSWIENFTHDETRKYFFFAEKLFYVYEGNLFTQELGFRKCVGEYNFKSSIKEYYMTNPDGVWYKDKNNVFNFASLEMQKTFKIESQSTYMFNCVASFYPKIDYCLVINRLALFSSPFHIKILPNVCRARIDLMASFNFRSNYICWRSSVSGEALYALK